MDAATLDAAVASIIEVVKTHAHFPPDLDRQAVSFFPCRKLIARVVQRLAVEVATKIQCLSTDSGGEAAREIAFLAGALQTAEDDHSRVLAELEEMRRASEKQQVEVDRIRGQLVERDARAADERKKWMLEILFLREAIVSSNLPLRTKDARGNDVFSTRLPPHLLSQLEGETDEAKVQKKESSSSRPQSTSPKYTKSPPRGASPITDAPRDRVRELEESLEVLFAERQAEEKEHAELKGEVAAARSRLKELKEELEEVTSQRDALQGEKMSLAEQLATLRGAVRSRTPSNTRVAAEGLSAEQHLSVPSHQVATPTVITLKASRLRDMSFAPAGGEGEQTHSVSTASQGKGRRRPSHRSQRRSSVSSVQSSASTSSTKGGGDTGIRVAYPPADTLPVPKTDSTHCDPPVVPPPPPPPDVADAATDTDDLLVQNAEETPPTPQTRPRRKSRVTPRPPPRVVSVKVVPTRRTSRAVRQPRPHPPSPHPPSEEVASTALHDDQTVDEENGCGEGGHSGREVDPLHQQAVVAPEGIPERIPEVAGAAHGRSGEGTGQPAPREVPLKGSPCKREGKGREKGVASASFKLTEYTVLHSTETTAPRTVLSPTDSQTAWKRWDVMQYVTSHEEMLSKVALVAQKNIAARAATPSPRPRPVRVRFSSARGMRPKERIEYTERLRKSCVARPRSAADSLQAKGWSVMRPTRDMSAKCHQAGGGWYGEVVHRRAFTPHPPSTSPDAAALVSQHYVEQRKYVPLTAHHEYSDKAARPAVQEAEEIELADAEVSAVNSTYVTCRGVDQPLGPSLSPSPV